MRIHFLMSTSILHQLYQSYISLLHCLNGMWQVCRDWKLHCSPLITIDQKIRMKTLMIVYPHSLHNQTTQTWFQKSVRENTWIPQLYTYSHRQEYNYSKRVPDPLWIILVVSYLCLPLFYNRSPTLPSIEKLIKPFIEKRTTCPKIIYTTDNDIYPNNPSTS